MVLKCLSKGHSYEEARKESGVSTSSIIAMNFKYELYLHLRKTA